MKKENVFLALGGLAIASSIAALVVDNGYGFAYGSLLVFAGYALSLCGGDKQITLPTQNLDDACQMMADAPGRWHLVSVPGHCVVAYRSERKALGAMTDAVGYAVVING